MLFSQELEKPPLASAILSALKRLRLRPELLFLPAYVFWLVVNIPPWFGGESVAGIFFRVGTFQLQLNPLFPFTYALAGASFGWALFRLRSVTLIRRLFLAASFPFAFVQSFENIYQGVGLIVSPAGGFFGGPAVGIGILVPISWQVLGFSTLPFWKPTLKTWALLAALTGGFAIWAVTSYPRFGNLLPDTSLGLALNVVLKFLTFLLFFFLITDGTRLEHSPDAH